MKVYGMWYGGPSYAPPDDDDIEVFESIEKAKIEFDNRTKLGYSWKQHFEYVNREPDDVYTPVVVEDDPEHPTEIWLYFEDPTDWGDKYPDRIIKYGARGGIVVERV